MKITFLTLYHNLDNTQSYAQAQSDLLYKWEKAIRKNNMPVISKAKISFVEYSFYDYPDQEILKKNILNAYEGTNGYWWAGDQYEDYEILFKALAEQKRLMELIIETEDTL